MKEKILRALNEGNLYSVIARNYNQMSKDELKDLCLEIYSVLVNTCNDCLAIGIANEKIKENLKKWRDWEL